MGLHGFAGIFMPFRRLNSDLSFRYAHTTVGYGHALAGTIDPVRATVPCNCETADRSNPMYVPLCLSGNAKKAHPGLHKEAKVRAITNI